jgi:hypothetical protein
MASKNIDPLSSLIWGGNPSAGALAALGLEEGENTAPKTKASPWDS